MNKSRQFPSYSIIVFKPDKQHWSLEIYDNLYGLLLALKTQRHNDGLKSWADSLYKTRFF